MALTSFNNCRWPTLPLSTWGTKSPLPFPTHGVTTCGSPLELVFDLWRPLTCKNLRPPPYGRTPYSLLMCYCLSWLICFNPILPEYWWKYMHFQWNIAHFRHFWTFSMFTFCILFIIALLLYLCPLTPWDPMGLPPDPLGPCRPTTWTLRPYRPIPWPPGTL